MILKSKQNVSLVTFLLSFCRNRGCWRRGGISSAKLRKNETWALVRTHKSRTWKSRHWWRIPSGNRGNWYAGSARRINQEERTNQAWTSRNERSGEEWERSLGKIKVNPDSFLQPNPFLPEGEVAKDAQDLVDKMKTKGNKLDNSNLECKFYNFSVNSQHRICNSFFHFE